MKKIFYSIFALATVAFSMVSCEDIPSPYNIPEKQSAETIKPAGDGLTAETAYNVAAIDSILDSGFSTDDDSSNPYYYIKGIICSRPSITTSYGNATYYISDDGTSNNQFYIYRSLSYNGAKFTSTDDLAYGDTVVVYTQVYSYSGTYETRSGVCQLVSRNGEQKGGGGGGTVDPAGDGTLNSPYNVAGIIQYTKSLGSNVNSPVKVYFKGIVSSVKECSTSFGNATFYISDDGSTTNEFYVYRTLGLNGGKITSETEVEAGDTVMIYGNVVNYSGNTPETVTKESYIYSITKGSGGGDTPASGGTKDDPYTVAQALSVAASLEKSSTSASYLSDEVYVKGKICKITDTTLSSYGNITYYISADGTDNNSLEVYRGFSFNGDKFTAIDDIKVGDEVVICGKLQNWLGTYEFTSGSKIYSLNGKTSGGGGGGDTPSGEGGISIDGTTVTLTSGTTAGSESVTVDFNTLGLANAAEVTKLTLSDNTTVTFDKGTGSTTPKFYTATKGIRVYGGNTITFNGVKNIAKVVMTCDSYNGTDYVGQTTATVSFSGNTAVYTNAGSATTQLRVQTMTIYYTASSAKSKVVRRR